jgi:glycosyltransferase involved in cell wall biosynthesis
MQTSPSNSTLLNTTPFSNGLQNGPTIVAGDRSISQIERQLDQLQALSEQLLEGEEYRVAAPEGPLPAGFKLSIVIPVYNELATLCKIVGRVTSIPCPKEIILVDDCSTDGTRDILKRFDGVDGIRVVYHEKNQGKGGALRTGFQHVSGSVVVVQDADLEYDPRDIPKLIVPLVKGEADVVYGSRFLGEEHRDKSWVHRLGNAVLTQASNLTTGLRLTDMETCYKAFRAEVIKDVQIEQNRFGFEPEITAKLAQKGMRFAEVPIGYQARTYEEGKKIGVKDLFNAFWCIFKYGLSSSHRR